MKRCVSSILWRLIPGFLLTFAAVRADMYSQEPTGSTIYLTDKQLEEIKHKMDSVFYAPLLEKLRIAHKLSSPDWTEHHYKGRDLLFCIDTLPSFGNSYINIYGWYLDPKGRVEHVLLYTTRGVGHIKFVFDDEKGVLHVKGAANNDYKGKDLIVVSLDIPSN